MKGSIFLYGLMIGLFSLLASCTNEDNLAEAFTTGSRTVKPCITQDEAYRLLVNYMVLKDKTYSLDLSAQEAEALGVPAVYYDMAVNELAETNKQIKEILKDPTTEFIWIDPQVELGKGNVASPTLSCDLTGNDFSDTPQWNSISWPMKMQGF